MFIDRFLLLLYDISKRTSVQRDLQRLQEASRFDRTKLDQFRDERVRDLIRHAYEKVPYYRNTMRQLALAPHDFNGVNDLRKLPPLRRKDLQAHQSELISEGMSIEASTRNTSSGSTGEPVAFYHDRRTQSASQAARYFSWQASGWRLSGRQITIWGSSTSVKEMWERPSSRMWAWLTRQQRVLAAEMTSDNKLECVLSEIIHHKPVYIDGYSNAITALALRAQDLGFSSLECKGVYPIAESLFEYKRDVIEAQFGPVYDQYGSSEIWAIAHQCTERRGYHVLEPHVVVELEPIPESKDGASRVLVTDLDNFGMPFIRYENGDLAKAGSPALCDCGSIFAYIERIIGREHEHIRSPDGSYYLVPEMIPDGIFEELSGIRQHQVALLKDGSIELRLVSSEALTRVNEDFLREHVGQYTRGSVSLHIRQVDRIEPGPSGKVNLVVRE